ncbi:Beta-1,4-galactosyltransferase 1 [Nymphon striatum]|nr:Beta-1,4-galactosyltransferase 1 [Nymphon striatum]
MKILESLLAVWRFFQRKFSVSLRTVMYAIIATTFISLTGWILRFDQTASPYSAKVFQYLSILSKTNLFNETIKNSNSSQTNFSWTLDSFTKSNSSSICPVISPLLKGSNLNDINSLKVKIPSWEEIELQHPELEPGGRHHPKCISRHKVAIIIPYRNRDEHLRAFTAYMHSFLQKQQLDYGIYVVEQMGNNSFNRAMLMNIGYREATLQHSYGCFIFHDVDLLPEIDQNLYVCSKTNPRHFSASINTHGYK